MAGALGRPLPGLAADGDVIHVGDDLTGTSATRITTSAVHGLDVISSDGDGTAGSLWRQPMSRSESYGVGGWCNRTDGYGVVGYAAATWKASRVASAGSPTAPTASA